MSEGQFGTLYFTPVTLGDDNVTKVIPKDVIDIIHSLDEFVVENEKTARHFLSHTKHPTPIREITLKTLDKNTPNKALKPLLSSLIAGKNVGLMSEAGCPGVADPGARLAALAHTKEIRVAPLVGPSSILLSLMASGFNGQCFTFSGYLPIDKLARVNKIKALEKRAKSHNETQIFIETPYRNNQMLSALLATCHPNTQLSVACNITLDNEYIVTKTVAQWNEADELPDLHKKPTVFLLFGDNEG